MDTILADPVASFKMTWPDAYLSSPVGLESLPAVRVKGRSAEVAVFALR
jgi:hypothetical protein